MIEYLSLKEFGEIHGWNAEAFRVEFNANLKKPDHLWRIPKPDLVIGGGRLRGRVPGLGLEPPEGSRREIPTYGYLPETATTWQPLGRGTRTDLIQAGRGTSPEYTNAQKEAATALLSATLEVINLLNTEPIGHDDAHTGWRSRYAEATQAREKAVEAYRVAFGAWEGEIPRPQAVLRGGPGQ